VDVSQDVGDDYQVVDKHMGFSFDVSNIISFQPAPKIYSANEGLFLQCSLASGP